MPDIELDEGLSNDAPPEALPPVSGPPGFDDSGRPSRAVALIYVVILASFAILSAYLAVKVWHAQRGGDA